MTTPLLAHRRAIELGQGTLSPHSHPAHRFSRTGTTRPRAIKVDPRVLGVEGMPIDAFRFDGVNRTYSYSAQDVLPRRDRFQVFRVDAVTYSAQMVQLQPHRDWPVHLGICEAMGHQSRPQTFVSFGEMAVAGGSGCPDPQPASWCPLDVAPKSRPRGFRGRLSRHREITPRGVMRVAASTVHPPIHFNAAVSL